MRSALLLPATLAAALLLTGCTDAIPLTGQADLGSQACVTSAATAKQLYTTATSPTAQAAAEMAVIGAVTAASAIADKVAADNPALDELRAAIQALEDRRTLSDVASNGVEALREQQAAVSTALDALGSACVAAVAAGKQIAAGS